jgi:hypothetical protein
MTMLVQFSPDSGRTLTNAAPNSSEAISCAAFVFSIGRERRFGGPFCPEHPEPRPERGREALVRTEIAVGVELLEPGLWIVLRRGRYPPEVTPGRIVRLDDAAVLALSEAHPRPQRLDQGEALHGAALRERLSHDRQHEGRVPRRAVEGHAAHGIDDGRVAEAPGDQFDVRLGRHPRNRRDEGRDLFRLDLPEQRGDERMRHAAGDRLDRQQLSGTDEDLMAGVQDAQLHRLEGMDLVREGGTDVVPVGAPRAERVLDHPSTVGLVRDRHVVRDPELAHQGALLRARGRDDAVDHRVGERAGLVDPLGQGGVGEAREAHDRLAQDRAVALQVVAAQPREGTDPTIATRAQGRDHGAEGGSGRVRVLGVMLDVGVGGVEGVGCGIEVVAALGHGQRHDADVALRHPFDQRAVPFPYR